MDRFERLELATPAFSHADHVKVALAMLNVYDYVDACSRYARTIFAMTEKLGVPGKYNTTITFAFMSLIAERKAHDPELGTDRFLERYPELLDSSILTTLYSKERIDSDSARQHFLLPDLLPDR
ncbi:MAG: hypothetical protein AAF525_11450 [Pseudomonadota bacterium]